VNFTASETGEGFELSTTLNQLTVSSLHPHWTYIFTVAAETSVGVGPPSMAVTATTPEDGKEVQLSVKYIKLSASTELITT